jgi:hypothetical protein
MSRVQVVTLHLEPGLSVARNITEGYGGVLRLSRSVQLDRFRACANCRQALAGQISSRRPLTMQCSAVKRVTKTGS